MTSLYVLFSQLRSTGHFAAVYSARWNLTGSCRKSCPARPFETAQRNSLGCRFIQRHMWILPCCVRGDQRQPRNAMAPTLTFFGSCGLVDDMTPTFLSPPFLLGSSIFSILLVLVLREECFNDRNTGRKSRAVSSSDSNINVRNFRLWYSEREKEDLLTYNPSEKNLQQSNCTNPMIKYMLELFRVVVGQKNHV